MILSRVIHDTVRFLKQTGALIDDTLRFLKEKCYLAIAVSRYDVVKEKGHVKYTVLAVQISRLQSEGTGNT